MSNKGTKTGFCLLLVLATLGLCAGGAKDLQELREKYRNLSGGQRGYAGSAAATAGPAGVSSAASLGGSNYWGQQPAARYPPPKAEQPVYAHPRSYYPAPHKPVRAAPRRAAPATQVPHYEPQYYSGYAYAGAGHPSQGAYPVTARAGFKTGPPKSYQHKAAPKSERVPKKVKQPYHGRPAYEGVGAATAGGPYYGHAVAAAGVAHYVPEYDKHDIDEEHYHEHYDEPETVDEYAAAAGTYNADPNNFYEEDSYLRDTESEEGHEEGEEEGDHYYNAQSYGKAKDENKHTAFNNDFEDIYNDGKAMRSTKSKTNFVESFNKAHRETGSGVTAHDRHKAQYSKDLKKLKESVDQRRKKVGEGFSENQEKNTHIDVEEEDEKKSDSRGLGNFPGGEHKPPIKRPQPPKAAVAVAAAAAASVGGSQGR